MSVSRRKFLRTGAVVSAALVLNPSTLVFGNDSITSNRAENKKVGFQLYSREMFEPYVGDTFRVRVGKQVIDLKLVALTDEKSKSNRKNACTNCFSMQFRALQQLPATVHTLNHSKLGNFDLFMVQSKGGGKFLQTAIVNHLA